MMIMMLMANTIGRPSKHGSDPLRASPAPKKRAAASPTSPAPSG